MQDKIANALLLSSSFIDNLGLLNGKLGISIYFFHLARYTNNKIFEKYAEELIDELCDEISVSTPLDFTDGLAGIGWGIEYLVQNNFIDANTDEVLLDFDNVLLELAEKQDMTIFNAISTGFFFIKRHRTSGNYQYILDKLVAFLDTNKDSIIVDAKVSLNVFDNMTIRYLLMLWFALELKSIKFKCPVNDKLLLLLLKEIDGFITNRCSPLITLFLKVILLRGLSVNQINNEVYTYVLQSLSRIELYSRSLLVQEVDSNYNNDVSIRILISFSYKYLESLDKDFSYQDEVDFWYNENCTRLNAGILSKIDLMPSTQDLGLLNGIAGIGLLSIPIQYD